MFTSHCRYQYRKYRYRYCMQQNIRTIVVHLQSTSTVPYYTIGCTVKMLTLYFHCTFTELNPQKFSFQVQNIKNRVPVLVNCETSCFPNSETIFAMFFFRTTKISRKRGTGITKKQKQNNFIKYSIHSINAQTTRIQIK